MSSVLNHPRPSLYSIPLLAFTLALGCSQGLDPDSLTNRTGPAATSQTDTADTGSELPPLDSAEPVEPVDTGNEPLMDYDGDGYPIGTDCDDLDPLLNHDDEDGDGVSSCDGDCDDRDPASSPLRSEVCDDVDNDCDGQPEIDGDGVCGIWWLEGSTWQKSAMSPSGSPHAPSTPIEVALSIEDRGEIWVLTHTHFHVLDPSTRSWTRSGSRDTLFPSLSGVSLQAGYAVASQYHSDGMVYLYLNGDDMAWIVQVDATTLRTTLYGSYQMSSLTDWSGSLAPSADELVGSWVDIYNANDWGVGSPASSCGSAASSLQTYMAFIDVHGKAYFYDADWCFQFVAAAPASGTAFFTYPGSPAPEIARAITWTGDQVFFFGP